jgi:outer membrane protein OmpA-like peptidoglycan-associated protein
MILAVVSAAFLLVSIAQAQTPQPIYKITINVVERSTTAVNFRHRGGSTRLDFRGTALMPGAHGEAEVEGQKGYIQVKTEMKDMPPASTFGPEFLTYVLWAITPEGRPVNLGEVILNDDHRGELDVTTDLQAFGLIVTAEPYFAVTQPSDVVVLENFVRPETKGIIEQINAKYELLQRGQYTVNVSPRELRPIPTEKHKPLDLYEAQNAIRIARWSGADKDAADSMAKAEGLLQQAETYQSRDPGSKPVSTAARGAVQAAEDARLIAVKRQDEARLLRERESAAAREAQAKEAAEEAAQQRAAAEAQKNLEAERRAAAEARADRARAVAAAEAAKAAQQQQAAQAQINEARKDAEDAKMEQMRLRQQLVEQFNRILETRETSRGLVVNMSDVLFDVGKWALKPGAREKLAKISAIIGQHPGLKIQVEGHTDSTGSEDTNQILSERRADAVRDFLVEQGVGSSTIVATGMGKSSPVTSNDTAVGRQLNRRVDDRLGRPHRPA